MSISEIFLSVRIVCMFLGNKGIGLQTLRGKQKYQVTNVGVQKNIGTQGVEVATLGGLLRVMIRVTHSRILVPDSLHSMSL